MRKPVQSAALAAVVLLVASVAFAADDEKIIFPGAARNDEPAKSVGGSVSSASLLIGLALAGVGGWMVLRNRRGTPIRRGEQALAVNETRSLGNRQYLVVASYEGKKFLIGVCPGRIDMLAPLNDGAVAGRRE